MAATNQEYDGQCDSKLGLEELQSRYQACMLLSGVGKF